MYFVIQLLVNVVRYFSNLISIKIYKDVIESLYVLMGSEILKLENTELDYNGSGVFIERVTKDLEEVVEIFSWINNEITNLVKQLGKIVAMFVISPLFAVFTIFTMVVLLFVENVRIGKINIMDKSYRKLEERRSSFTSELVRGVNDIKVLNSEKSFLNKFSDIINNVNKNKYEMEKTDRNFASISEFLMNIFDFSFLLLYMILLVLLKH